MKNLLLILLSFCLFYCKKKEEVLPQTTSANTSTTPGTPITPKKCVDSTYTLKSKVPLMDHTIRETCTGVTITYNVVKKTVYIPIPNLGGVVTNYTNYIDYQNGTDPNRIYYSVRRLASPDGRLYISAGQQGSAYGTITNLNKL
jgi:hypothetical protein